MKIFEINSVPYGSTGRIMFQIAEKVEMDGGVAFTAATYVRKRNIKFPDNYYQINGPIGKYLHLRLAKVTGKHGCYSHYSTKRLIRKIRKVSPDIIHLHNLHEGVVNIPMFFKFLKEYRKPVIWTLHDCWAFTGHCPHFTYEQCYKWKKECYECIKYEQYPTCKIDDSTFQYNMKKKAFQNVPNLMIVTPSKWLKMLVEQSYLSEYPVKVIHNGIDLEKFKPTESKFREKYGLQNKYILLGVAFDWGIKKGIDVFEKLAKELDDNFTIVLVGVRPQIKRQLPKNIISIETTQNQYELAKIYSAADLLVNPTLEDNFPTVNMEALACGTPVLTYQTGGSPETIDDSCGWVIPYNNYEMMKKKIICISKENTSLKKMCVKKAEEFNNELSITKYLDLYNYLCMIKKEVEN